MNICLSANSQLDHRKLRLWENGKKQYAFLQHILLFKFCHWDFWYKELAGFLWNFAFCTNKYIKSQRCNESYRSSLQESFNMEISLQSPKGATKVAGGHLKLIRKKSMKERCQVNTLPETASYFHEAQYFFLTNSAASCFQGLGTADLIPLKLTWKSPRFTCTPSWGVQLTMYLKYWHKLCYQKVWSRTQIFQEICYTTGHILLSRPNSAFKDTAAIE